MTSKSLFAADRGHHICLRDAKEHCRPLQAARQVPCTRMMILRVRARSRYLSQMLRNDSRPMHPKPLMPTLTTMMFWQRNIFASGERAESPNRNGVAF